MLKTGRENLVIAALSVSLVVGVVLTAGCAGAETATQETAAPPPETAAPARETKSPQIIEDVTAQKASTLIEDNRDNADFVIIDVRTPEEFAGGHIADAGNIDFYSPAFRSEINKLDRDRTYLIYCRSGNRSGSALKIMKELNFKEVYNIADGIVGWDRAGLPIVK